MSEVLWCNCEINLERSGILSRSLLLDKRLKHVGDIYDVNEKRMLTANEIARKYHIFPTLALTIIRSIPRQWRIELDREKPNTFDRCCNDIATLESKPAVAKWAYGKLLAEPSPPEKAIAKWRAELSIPNEFEWTKIFEQMYCLTDDIVLRWLQFRILHRILPTNKRLELFGIKATDKCHRCPIHIETLLHLFWSCPTVSSFWRELGVIFCVEFNVTSVI